MYVFQRKAAQLENLSNLSGGGYEYGNNNKYTSPNAINFSK